MPAARSCQPIVSGDTGGIDRLERRHGERRDDLELGHDGLYRDRSGEIARDERACLMLADGCRIDLDRQINARVAGCARSLLPLSFISAIGRGGRPCGFVVTPSQRVTGLRAAARWDERLARRAAAILSGLVPENRRLAAGSVACRAPA